MSAVRKHAPAVRMEQSVITSLENVFAHGDGWDTLVTKVERLTLL